MPGRSSSQAFGASEIGTVIGAKLPEGKFDLVAVYPNGQGERTAKMLRLAAEEAFSLRSRTEERRDIGYVIEAGPRLKLTPTASTGGSSTSSGAGEIRIVGGTIGTLTGQFERQLRKPIMDRPGGEVRYHPLMARRRRPRAPRSCPQARPGDRTGEDHPADPGHRERGEEGACGGMNPGVVARRRIEDPVADNAPGDGVEAHTFEAGCPGPFVVKDRLRQFALITSTLGFCWLGMQAVHELGHVAAAFACGEAVNKVVLHPLAISRADATHDRHPLPVIWGGPAVGTALPLAFLAVARLLRCNLSYLFRFFAGFCLIANGLYLGVGSFEGVGDAGDLLRHGCPRWMLIAFGLACAPAGLGLWHGLGPHFGLGKPGGAVDRRAVRWAAGLFLAIAAAEILLAAILL
jgi:hypothetical protein